MLQRFASTMARRLAHLPLAGMRAAAAHASTDAVDAFFREAKLRRPANGEATAADASAVDAAAVDGSAVNGSGTRWKPDVETADRAPGRTSWAKD